MKFEDVGINKAFGNIFQNINRKWFYNSIQFFIRYSGFFLLLVIVYFHFVFKSLAPQNQEISIWIWIGSYLVYLIFLESLRAIRVKFYDTEWFVFTRVILNIFFVSWILFVAPYARYILSFAYLISYILTIIYFPKKLVMIMLIYIFSIAGLLIACTLLSQQTPLYIWQVILISIVLFLSLYISREVYVVLSNISDEISEVSKRLQDTHSIAEVVNEIAIRVNMIPGAEDIFVLIIEPEKQSYVWHTLIGLRLKSSISMEDLITQCKVLRKGKSYQNDDIAGTTDELYFEQFFSPPPRSLLVEPIYGLDNKILGLILAGNSKPAHFDTLNKRFFKQICASASPVVESSLLRMKAKVGLVTNKSTLEQFLNAEKESEIVRILIKQSIHEINNSDGCVLHYLDLQTNNLFPVAGAKMTETSDLELWEENLTQYRQSIKSVMKIGVGIAGQCLLKKEAIYAPDITNHPWFEGSTKTHNFSSLISLPLIDPDHDNVLIGTLSLYSNKKDAFTFEDQAVLESLVFQGAKSISKIREFETWRLNGGPIKKVFESVLNINYDEDEGILYHKIAEIGKNILPFGTVRIRILDESTNELVTRGVAGYPDEDVKELLNNKLSHNKLLQFLLDEYRVERSYLIPSDAPFWKEFADENLYVPQNTLNSGWNSYDALFTPITSRENRTLGYIAWDQPENNERPSKRNIEALGAFASMVAWSIDLINARRRIQEQNELITSLITSTTEQLSTTGDPKATNEVTVRIARDILNVEGCSLYIAKENELILENSTFLKNTDFIGQRKPIQAVPGGGLTTWVASTMLPLCFKSQDEYQKHPGWTGNRDQVNYLPSKKCNSLLIVPIKGQSQKIIGVITFENKLNDIDNEGFKEIDIKNANYLADKIGIALPLAEQLASLRTRAQDVLEDDLHELKNLFQNGIRSHLQAALRWINKGDMKNSFDELVFLDKNTKTILDELYTLHNTVQRRYYEIDNFKDALSLLINNLLTRYIRSHNQRKNNIIIDCPDKIDLPPGFRYVLLRIASGALMNAISHSGFLKNPNIEVGIRLREESGHLVMTVYDTGKGATKFKSGYGIDRMNSLIGKLRDKGFNIKLRIQNQPNGFQVKLISKIKEMEAESWMKM